MIKILLSKSVIVNRKHLCCNQHQIHIYLLLTENVQNFNFTRKKKKELKQFKRNENRQLCAIKNVKKKNGEYVVVLQYLVMFNMEFT